MQRLMLLAFAVVASLAAGCVRSIQPILLEEQVIINPAVEGKWIEKDGKSIVGVHPAGAEKTYGLLFTDKDGKKAPLHARLGKIGDYTIAEFHPDDPAPDASDVYRAHLLPLYSFLIVKESKPRLVMAVMSADWLKKFLDGHPNELKVAMLDKDNLIITSPTAEIQAFLLRHSKDEGALSDDMIYVRPGDPSTQPAAPAQ